MVWRICEGCGKEDDIPYYSYVNEHTKCRSCALTGIKPSDETKRKMSKSGKGSKNSMYGKHHTEEAKKKISDFNIGRTHSDETKKKMSESQMRANVNRYGKTPSDETIRKMSLAQIGKTHSVETKKRMSKAQIGVNNHNYGKHHSDETKQKISMAAQGVNEISWAGYSTKTSYPKDFTKDLRIEIRMSTNDCDFLTGEHKDICNDGKELSVHHIDYDKQNSDIRNLVPLSSSNHSKTNTNRIFWTRLFTNMQNVKYLLLELD
jgi:hypothetical protein